MIRRFSLTPALLAGLLPLVPPTCSVACDNQTGSITNLPAISGSGYQVFGLNATGQLTGFFYISDQHPGHAFRYDSGQLADLGTLGGSTSEGHGINSSGQVVGRSDLPGNAQSHAFVAVSSSLLDLGTLGGPSSTGTAINDSGVVIGDSDLPAGSGRSAFISTNATLVGLGTLGGSYSSAFALNNSNIVVGESAIVSGDVHGIVYSNGILSDLGTLGGSYSSAFAINDAGEIVGESSVNSTDIHGFAFVNGVMTDVGTFGGTYSSAYLVNSNGQAAGVANISADSETHGFIYATTGLTDLGTLGGIYTFPNALNNLGQVVGDALTTNGVYHAFLWSKGQITDLNSLLPESSGWELVSAQYINDSGRVVGVGNYAGLSQWFVLDLANGNKPPMAVAGPGQLVDCQAQATLDGSGSTGNALTFEWSSGGNVLGTSVVLSVALPLGTNQVTLKVTDTCGASSQANVTVVVADTTPPVGSCPPPVTASADSNCQAPVPNLAAQVIATDNCTSAQALTITQTPLAGTLMGLGAHPVAITVTDPSGNSSSCMVLFTVVDTTPPAILSTPGPINLSAGSDCQAQVPDVLAHVTATDSCSPTELVKIQSPAAGTLIGVGASSVLITVLDAAGNKTTATVSLTVSDTTPPSIVSGPAPVKVSADANCQGMVPNILGGVLATDNCTPANQIVLSQNPAAGTVLPRGQYTIVVTASDLAGNSSALSVPLEIDDTTAPVILSSPAPVALSVDAHCQAAVPNVLAGVVATDNCTLANQLVKTQSPAAGSVLGVGSYSIVVTVSDAAGNKATTTVSLTIADTTAPSILSGPSAVKLPADAHCQGVVPNVLNQVLVSDNCTAASQIVLTQSPAAGAVLPSGLYTIVVTATDASGNSSKINVPLEIDDTTPPIIVSVPAPVTLSANAHCQATVPNVLSGVVATDNCTPANQLVMTQSPAAGTVLTDGQYSIAVTVSDAAGNASTTSIPLTIIDTTAPVFQSIAVSPNTLSPPNHALIPVAVSVSVTDNCDAAPATKIVSISCNDTISPGDVQITGSMTATLAASKASSGGTRIYTITVQATDASGNSSTAQVTVSVPKSGGTTTGGGNPKH